MKKVFIRLACAASEVLGTFGAFLAAAAVVLVWALTGPLFHFSDSWQLVINTGTTIVTFLMVFLIQATQNRESRALHLKLDELIRVQGRARNLFTRLERATDEEIAQLEREFDKLRAKAEHRRKLKAERDAAPSGTH